MAGIFGIGVSGIQAAQMGMVVTQHNITNSNTPGYNRQSVLQTTQEPVAFSTGFIGNGTRVSTIERSYNAFLTDQVRQSDSVLSSLDAHFKQIQIIDDLLADANAGVSPALQNFFKGLQDVAASPASMPARQSMVSSAQALVARLQGADQRISDLYGQVNEQISDQVSLINTYGQQIAKLNEQIIVAESAVSQPANDLQDRRDQLLSELNQLVKVQTIPESNGSVQVMLGRGQPLVLGTQVNVLTATRSSIDPARITVAMDLGGGSQELPEFLVDGGELGGLLQFRSSTLDSAVNSLGKLAANLALTFNAQHENGMDLLGRHKGEEEFAADFFTLGQPKTIPRNGSEGDLAVGFNSPILDFNVAENYFSNLTNSDYELTFSSGEYRLTRLSDGKMWSANDLGTVDNPAAGTLNALIFSEGFHIDPDASSIFSGDSFLIQPTREMAKNIGVNTAIAGDVRLIAAASPYAAKVGLQNVGGARVEIQRIYDAATTSLSDPLHLDFDEGLTIGIVGNHFSLQAPDGTVFYPADTSYRSIQINVYAADGEQRLVGAPPGAEPAFDNTLIGSGPELEPGATYEIEYGTQRIRFSISGSPQSGDTFTIRHNYEVGVAGKEKVGVSDTTNILLLGKLQTQKTSDGASSTYQNVYAQMVSDVGNKARELEVTKNAQQSLVDQANQARAAESGVNLDEEAANLLKFQQLYQASARSISVAQKVFDELLAIAGG